MDNLTTGAIRDGLARVEKSPDTGRGWRINERTEAAMLRQANEVY